MAKGKFGLSNFFGWMEALGAPPQAAEYPDAKREVGLLDTIRQE
jgi:hypothetical protein